MRSNSDRFDMSPALDFMRRVLGEVECWPWPGRMSKDGYGFTTWEGLNRAAHRVAYEVFVEPIPDNLELDHLCRNPGCVNPSHLEPVTPAENKKRARNRPGDICKRGHVIAGDNIALRGTEGHIGCRACLRLNTRQRRMRLRLQGKEVT